MTQQTANPSTKSATPLGEAIVKPKRQSRAKSLSQISSSLRLLDINDICDLTRLNEKTIERMIVAKEFPKPFSVREDSSRPARRWTLAQFEQWSRRRSQQAEEASA